MTANALLCVVGLAPAVAAACAATQRFSLTNKVLRMIYVLLLCYAMHRHGPRAPSQLVSHPEVVGRMSFVLACGRHEHA